MLGWIEAHTEVLNLAVNVGMLLVWLVYLQLFLFGYLNQRRPSILITRGAGDDLDARCIVGNMSSDPVYVMSILAELTTREGSFAHPVTDLRTSGEGNDEPLAQLTKQGPLLSGRYMDVESYRRIVDRVSRAGNLAPPDGTGDSDALEIVVVAIHGSDDLIIGARRRFRLERREGAVALVAVRAGAEQIRSRRARRALLNNWTRIETRT